MSGIVAIIGRPNVGKSTLFNRLTETREAIVDDTPGTTRDRHYGTCEWQGRTFTVVDTGGYIHNSDDVFEKEIRKQIHIAINEADVILFLVDGTSDITDLDDAVAELLRKSNKNVLLVANKIDSYDKIYDIHIFHKLGLGEIFAISAMTGSGTGELLDRILELLPERKAENLDETLPKIAIVGRPNVGKSSLLNLLMGEERHIVTPIAGTTRDSIYTKYNKFGMDFYLIDTAGIRKKQKFKDHVEFYSIMRTIRAIEYSDVCLLLLDASEGIQAQDVNIFSLIQRNHKGIVLVVNKWDLIEKTTKTSKEFEEYIRKKIEPFSDVPIIFASVKEKQRVYKVLEKAIEVFENRKRRIPTHELNEFLLQQIEKTPPPAYKGKYIKIKYVTQLPTPYPSFALYCNLPQYIKQPYKRFIENTIRKQYTFEGTPMEIYFRKK
ncbi:MAG: ribosome biogenesis GTPase Der [Bacteroidales bacterium]|nr:ribosome biogenesis GTPase Der [Bacteroidales bacterium]